MAGMTTSAPRTDASPSSATHRPRASLAAILRAVAEGAGSTAAICRRTGAEPEAAETALAALAAAGRVRRELVFAGACIADACGGCRLAAGCASAGAGSLVGSGLTAWRVTAQ